MPLKKTERVKKRKEKVLQFINEKGCVMTWMVMKELGLSHTMAEYVLEEMAASGLVRKYANLSKTVVIWCRDEEAYRKFMEDVAKPILQIICGAKIKYVSPARVIDLLGPKVEKTLLGRYLPRIYGKTGRPVATALKFVDMILENIGTFITMRGKRKIYYIDKCKTPEVAYDTRVLTITVRHGDPKYVISGSGRFTIYADDFGIVEVRLEIEKAVGEIDILTRKV